MDKPESESQSLLTKLDLTRAKIVRALLCAAGEHEPWEQYNNHGYKEMDVVRMSIDSREHGDVYCCVCKYCRTVYVRRREE